MTAPPLSRSLAEQFALVAPARSADPDVGPLALGRLLDALAPRLAHLARPWAATLPRPHLTEEDLVVSLQLHLAHVLERCRASTPGEFGAWVRTTAVRHLLHVHRTERRAARRDRVAAEGWRETHASPADSDAGFETEDLGVDAHAAVSGAAASAGHADAGHRVLHALPAGARRVLELRAAPGASWRTVAAALGVSVGAARRRHARALALARAQVAAPAAGPADCPGTGARTPNPLAA